MRAVFRLDATRGKPLDRAGHEVNLSPPCSAQPNLKAKHTSLTLSSHRASKYPGAGVSRFAHTG